MSPEQKAKLEARICQYVDRLIDLSDPTRLPGADKMLDGMDRKERGDLDWSLKVLNLAARVPMTLTALIASQQANAGGPAPPIGDDTFDQLTAQLERAAAAATAAMRKAGLVDAPIE